MGLTRPVLERQLEAARADLAAWVSELKDAGVADGEFRRNPRWRSLNAACRTIQTRLRSLGEVEAREAAAAERKSGEE